MCGTKVVMKSILIICVYQLMCTLQPAELWLTGFRGSQRVEESGHLAEQPLLACGQRGDAHGHLEPTLHPHCRHQFE